MKKILILLFIINFSTIYAQKKPTIFKSNPFKKASLILKKDDTINGYIKLNNFNKIIFKKNEGNQRIIYDHKTVKGVIIYIGNLKKSYEYKKVNSARFKREQNKIFHHLVQPIIIGNVSIYLDDYGAHDATDLKKNIGYTTYMTPQRYYISNGKTNTLSILGDAKVDYKPFDSKFYSNNISTINDIKINPNSRKFSKIVKKYFFDCPKLITNIKSGYFGKKEFLLVIKFYNENCE